MARSQEPAWHSSSSLSPLEGHSFFLSLSLFLFLSPRIQPYVISLSGCYLITPPKHATFQGSKTPYHEWRRWRTMNGGLRSAIASEDALQRFWPFSGHLRPPLKWFETPNNSHRPLHQKGGFRWRRKWWDCQTRFSSWIVKTLTVDLGQKRPYFHVTISNC